MKTLFLILGLAVAAGPARAAELQYWADEATRKVYFVTRPEVSVKVSNIGADDDYWDMVSVDVDYSNPKMEEYFAALKAKFPGYQYMRLFMNAQDDFKFSIPVLGINETVKAMPGIDGPWMHWEGFVTRAKSELVRRTLAQPNGISVAANVSVTYKETKTLERVELGTEVCQELASREGTIFGSIISSVKIIAEIDSRHFQFPETRKALLRSVFDSCLELPGDPAAGSFGRLLDTPVELRARPTRPFGETRREVSTPAVVPLQMDVFVQVPGGRS